jgi:hypothetical protein
MVVPSSSTITVKIPPAITSQALDDYVDLTLIVGTDGVRFKISSHAMWMSSPVWKAMLTGPFKESKAMEIPFPEDSPEALLNILKIAHTKFNTLPKLMNRQQLVDLAVLCDKYDLVSVIRPWLGSWNFGPATISSTEYDIINFGEIHGEWLFICWVFGHERGFVDVANYLAKIIRMLEDGRCFVDDRCIDENRLLTSLDVMGMSCSPIRLQHLFSCMIPT